MDEDERQVSRGRRGRAAAGLLLGGLLMGAADGPARQEGFLDALRAGGPAEDRGGARDLYGPLIGSWEGEVVDHLDGGAEQRQSAEFHFAWVLEGRAVQDLWIAPARSERPKVPGTGNRYGTTLRVYDPKLDAWRITWINPVTGAENHLVGRRVGSQIVQTGSDSNGRLVRWVFVEITEASFHWRGESSGDGGQTWTCETEFFARRTAARPPS
jgi:hypothetical protein